MGDAAAFVPGGYWTRERAEAAFKQMVASRDAPEMQTLMKTIGEMAAESDPAAAAASMAESLPPQPVATGAILREQCVYRRGKLGDIPQLATLIVSGELPPFFLEPFVEGFLVIEHEGRPVGCGGIEFYEGDAVIRSVVVDPAARGLGLGLDIARLLEEDALMSGARDIYLFTLHAWEFWKRLGYRDLPIDEWPANVRENWQYQFVAGFPQASRDVHAMIRTRS
jgi:N-acetylglutamate synthase-like GNAT family acetyltransferase